MNLVKVTDLILPPWAQTADFSGHRPEHFGGYEEDTPLVLWVKYQLRAQIVQAIIDGYTCFISGGALGVDQWAAEIVLSLKAEFPHIKLVVARPFPSHGREWPLPARQRYARILEQADIVVDVSPDPWSKQKLDIRNHWMCDRSKRSVVVWDGSASGTGNFVRYFMQNKGSREFIRIDPREFTGGH